MSKPWAVFLLCLAGCFASATTIIPVSVERLTRESSHVIEGTATERWSQWNQQHTLIFTYTKFHVMRSLKGQAPNMVVVRQIGGSAEGYTQRVAGVRQWNPGDHAVLFLRPSQSPDGTLEVTGLMQGNFLVRTNESGEQVVSNGVPRVSAYQAGSQEVVPYQGAGMKLQQLESRVQKAVQP